MKRNPLPTLAAALAACALAGCGPADPPVPPDVLSATYDALLCPELYAAERDRRAELTAAERDMDIATRNRMTETAAAGGVTGVSSEEMKVRRRIQEHQTHLGYLRELLAERECVPPAPR